MIPIKILNPRNALNSSTVIFSHLSNFSGPITNLAYALLCFTISHIRSGEKYKSKTSTGSEEISSTGPVGEVNGWIGIHVVAVVQVDLEAPQRQENQGGQNQGRQSHEC